MTRSSGCGAALRGLSLGAVGMILFGVQASGCSSSKSCIPGQSIACVGVGGCRGGQQCTTDGSGYGPCQCGSSTSATGSGGTTGTSGGAEVGSTSGSTSATSGSSSGGGATTGGRSYVIGTSCGPADTRCPPQAPDCIRDRLDGGYFCSLPCTSSSQCQVVGDLDDAGIPHCNGAYCEVTCGAGDAGLFCPYNESCVQTNSGPSLCEVDPRMGVLCQNCSLGAGASGDECGVSGAQGADFCLIDLHGNNTFCGVDCSTGQSCPSGYECDDVIILTQNPCSGASQCTPSNIKCSAGCPSDSQCVKGPSGDMVCAPYCVADEGNGQGFCTCVSDSDCPQDNCETTTATCRISQQPCVVGPSGDAFCRSFITCVDVQGVRGCFIGRNCAPASGLHCPVDQ